MKVTDEDVGYVAGLANLELSSEERTRLLRDLNSILDYVNQLNELDTSSVQPMAQLSNNFVEDGANENAETFACASRDDIPERLRKSLPREVALANAPETDGIYFRVPKVIER